MPLAVTAPLEKPLLGLLLLSVLSSPAIAGTATTVHTFIDGPDGANPSGGLVQDSEGNFYGQTLAGGSVCPASGVADVQSGCGVVYKIAPDGTLTTLVAFNGKTGAAGAGTLALVGNTTLVGSAAYDTGTGKGLLFSVNTDGSNYTVLHRFSGPDGYQPRTAPIVTAGHTVYGVTLYGGPAYVPGRRNGYVGNGVLFSLQPDGTYTILHAFTKGADGYDPGPIIVDSAGVIYGTAGGGDGDGGGGGIVYSFNPATSTFQLLYSFNSHDGDGPMLGAVTPDGTIYGATFEDGTPYEVGTLFELKNSATSYKLKTLWNFTGGADGQYPGSAPLLGADGSLTGTTTGNETGAGSVLYRYANGTMTTLYTFGSWFGATGTPNPTQPDDTPLVTASGTIYLTTTNGGAGPCYSYGTPEGCGTVFEYTP